MSLNVAIQMDPVEGINIETDNSFLLGLEAQRRGHSLFYYNPASLTLDRGRLFAHIRPLALREEKGNHYTYGPEERMALDHFDLILMRQDPPFNMAYITATHMLEHVAHSTLVLNDPVAVRNAPEKLLVTHFPDLMPPTLISANRDDIRAFRREYGDIVLKPLYGNAGAQIFHVKPDDENFNALLETFALIQREPIMIQKYLPEIRQKGDKRIILVEGKIAGAMTRIPAAGEARANMHIGGKAIKTEITERDKYICAAIGPELAELGLAFAGIDVIGDYLTEINVTSPTGIRAINKLYDLAIERNLWDAFEKRLHAFKQAA